MRRAILFAIVFSAWTVHGQGPARSSYASEVARLSDPGGTFDTDNLISNEREYLSVIPALVAGGVSGGTYLGVGPDQNFSYIARIRPSQAYIIDIRRDNLLLHLLFKALFERSATRVEYLSLLTGRAPPRERAPWTKRSIVELVAYVDGRPAENVADLRRRLDATVATFGVPLTKNDLTTIERFHRTFISEGLGLQFRTFGRAPRPFYPTLRDLLTATAGDGKMWNYLASEDDFQFIKSLQARHGIVPVVGDISSATVMRRIADTIAARGDHVSAFYVSNVQTYFSPEVGRPRFLANVRALPHDGRSVLIRSVFGQAGESRSLLEPMDAQ